MICPDCNGIGLVTVSTPDKKLGRKNTCFRCNGTGEICDRCGESIDCCQCDEEESE